MEMKNDVLRTAVELNIIFSNESSILISVVIRKNRKISKHHFEYFGERAFWQSMALKIAII
jgi:hypothetical protein